MCDQEHILCEWVSACNKAASHKYSLTIKARQFVKCVQVLFFFFLLDITVRQSVSSLSARKAYLWARQVSHFQQLHHKRCTETSALSALAGPVKSVGSQGFSLQTEVNLPIQRRENEIMFEPQQLSESTFLTAAISAHQAFCSRSRTWQLTVIYHSRFRGI